MGTAKRDREQHRHQTAANSCTTDSSSPAPRPGPLRVWSYRLVALTVVPLLLFALLEGGLRLAGFGHSTSFWVPSADGQAYVTNVRFGWTFFPRHLARAPVPCRLPARKANGTLRIFVLGESAAMGTPDSSFGLARFLQAMLEQQHPDVHFEVVNAAMTAINSHAIVNIADDCLRLQPDALVVYMGNNEFVGPYGPGTVFSGFARSRWLIRASIAARSTRIGQLVERAVAWIGVGATGPQRWQGLEMFLSKEVPPQDQRAEVVYRHFRQNLVELCRAASRRGVPVLLCTVAVNLKDCPPLASAHITNPTEADLAQWKRHYQSAVQHAAQREHRAAIEELTKALKIAPVHAETHYLLAHSYLATEQVEKATEHLRLARDYDVLRFRADSHINDIIRQVAAEFAEQGVILVDAEQRFAACSTIRHGIPGEEFFYEHVHLKPEGNHLLASAVLQKLASCLPDLSRQAPAVVEAPSLEACARRLALTPWDSYRMAAAMEDLVARPPFTNQLDHSVRLAELRRQVARLEAQAVSTPALAQADQWYRQAIRQRGDDVHLRANYATLLYRMSKYEEAERQLRMALEKFPQSVGWLSTLADVLSKQGRWQEALDVLSLTMELEPWNAAAIRCSMAAVLIQQGRTEEAEQHFRQAIRLDPNYAPAANGLGGCLLHQGRIDEAILEFRKAAAVDPLMVKAYGNLGSAYLMRGDLEQAEKYFRRALELAPREGSFHRSLGTVLVRRGQLKQAIAELRAGLLLAPADPDLYCQLGSLLEGQGRPDEALKHFDAALGFQPEHLRAGHNKAALLARLGRTAEAIEQYRAVLRHHPNSAITLNNLAWLLATARNPLCRDGAEAVRLAQRAAQQPDHNPLQVLATLAAAYAEAGDFDQAASTAAQAVQMATEQHQPEVAAAMRRQLQSYRQRQPWRELRQQ